MKIGLVIAQKENNLSDLKKYALETDGVDFLLFPEGYLTVNQLNEVSQIMAKSRKWLATSYSDESGKDKSEMGGSV